MHIIELRRTSSTVFVYFQIEMPRREVRQAFAESGIEPFATEA
jgi:hypothetical protein